MCRYEAKVCQNTYLIWTDGNKQCNQGAVMYICFTSLTYVPEQICLSHSTHLFHYTVPVVCIWTPYQHTNNSTKKATFIYHDITIYVPATNIPLKCHICHMLKLLKIMPQYVTYEVPLCKRLTSQVYNFHLCHQRLHSYNNNEQTSMYALA